MHKRITPDTDPYMKMVWMLKHSDFKKTLKDLRSVTVKSNFYSRFYLSSTKGRNIHPQGTFSFLKEFSQLCLWLLKNLLKKLKHHS